MADLLVRSIDPQLKAGLQRRARAHHRTVAEEVRHILSAAVEQPLPSTLPLGSRIHARFAGLGLDREIEPLRGYPARPADLTR